MPDNVGYTPGAGATIAADDVGGALYQRIKVTHGADGVAVDVSPANPLPVTSAEAIGAYALNDFVDAATQYIGRSKANGTWLIQRFVSASGEMRYANASNNAGVASYAAAWSSRASLSYGLFHSLSGV